MLAHSRLADAESVRGPGEAAAIAKSDERHKPVVGYHTEILFLQKYQKTAEF